MPTLPRRSLWARVPLRGVDCLHQPHSSFPSFPLPCQSGTLRLSSSLGYLSRTRRGGSPDDGSLPPLELFPGGSKVDVTHTNRLRYINLVAKHYLHDRIRRQSGAFFHGLYQVIPNALLGIFSAPELQVLISGTLNGISTADLRNNCEYNGYFSADTHIRRFWTVFDSFDDEDKGRLIKFVTSCERPPSLGFVDLTPPFTIQRVDCSDDSRLPTASTCFNVLKLPTYSSQSILKAKLQQAIRSASGFELS